MLDERVSNARVESASTKPPLMHRMAFGFRTAGPLIALAQG